MAKISLVNFTFPFSSFKKQNYLNYEKCPINCSLIFFSVIAMEICCASGKVLFLFAISVKVKPAVHYRCGCGCFGARMGLRQPPPNQTEVIYSEMSNSKLEKFHRKYPDFCNSEFRWLSHWFTPLLTTQVQQFSVVGCYNGDSATAAPLAHYVYAGWAMGPQSAG